MLVIAEDCDEVNKVHHVGNMLHVWTHMSIWDSYRLYKERREENFPKVLITKGPLLSRNISKSLF